MGWGSKRRRSYGSSYGNAVGVGNVGGPSSETGMELPPGTTGGPTPRDDGVRGFDGSIPTGGGLPELGGFTPENPNAPEITMNGDNLESPAPVEAHHYWEGAGIVARDARSLEISQGWSNQMNRSEQLQNPYNYGMGRQVN